MEARIQREDIDVDDWWAGATVGHGKERGFGCEGNGRAKRHALVLEREKLIVVLVCAFVGILAEDDAELVETRVGRQSEQLPVENGSLEVVAKGAGAAIRIVVGGLVRAAGGILVARVDKDGTEIRIVLVITVWPV